MKDPTSLPLRRREGFSLLEVSVALALFVVVTLVSAPLLTNITNFYTDSLFRSNLMESAKVAQERLLDQMLSAKVLSLNTGGTYPVLTFVVPVEQNNGTKVDFIDATGAVYWGAVESTGPMVDAPGSPHRLTLTVVPSSTVTEAQAALDLNNDGDQLDTFQTGNLVLQTSGGLTTELGSQRLLIKQVGAASFDMDGDSAADPLFRVGGEAFTDGNLNGFYDTGEAFVDSNLDGSWDGYVTVNLLSFSRDRTGRGHRFAYRTNVPVTVE